MRRLFALFFALLVLMGLPLSAHAATQASGVSSHATVATDGSCQVTLTITLHLEEAISDLTFPLPRAASNVTLNGSWVRTKTTETARLVDLSGTLGGLTGDFSITIQYSMSRLVTKNDLGQLELELPLLAGFAYPIAQLDFSVTLPGQTSETPAFSSGYHGVNIEKDLDFSVNGATITGSSTTTLKDRETLVMTLPADAQMFPQAQRYAQNFSFSLVSIAVCAVLALAYWLLFLRCPIPRPSRWSAVPESISAGQIPCVVHLQGADLTMMVFTWAQLGYLTIQTDGQNRVQLIRRMDMGNERSSFELRYFRELFGRHDTVDCTGSRYTRLCQKAASQPGGMGHIIHPRTGNPKVFRALAALIGLFTGGSLAAILSSEALLQWLIVGIFGILGGISSWLIQNWAAGLGGRNRGQLLPCLVSCAGWLFISFLANQLFWGLLLILSQLLAGLMAFFGGRRTPEGNQARRQLLGLRRYLCSISKDDLHRMYTQEPEYFFELAPYAMALGADTAFARRFGSRRLPACPYLQCKGTRDRSALDWCRLMQQTAAIMDSGLAQSRKDAAAKLLRSLLGK